MALVLNGTTGIVVADGATIGSSSDADAITIPSTGRITFSQAILAQAGIQPNSNSFTAAEVLDDYEEGTFTPTINASGFTSITYSRQDGHYTKVGNQVNCYITLQWTGTSAAGQFRIEGLPFTSANTASSKGMFITYSTASTYLNHGDPNMYIGDSQNFIRAYYNDGNAVNVNANASADWFEGVVVYNT